MNIHVSYGYNGFLYFPIHVADICKLFPENIKLDFTEGDKKTILTLFQKDTDEDKYWFAICDPFAKDLKIPELEKKHSVEIAIVGAFIVKLPIWLYNKKNELHFVNEEEEFNEHYKNEIKQINCYTEYSTGYMIAKRLITKGYFKDARLNPQQCGKEFNGADDSTLVVTADILHIINDIDDPESNNILLQYPKVRERKNGLNPYLFTAILTTKEVINKDLNTVLTVLSSVKKSIDRLINDKNGNLDFIKDDDMKKLINKYEGKRIEDISDDLISEKRATYKKCLKSLIEGPNKIYKDDFDLRDVKKGYYNAKRTWEEVYTDTNFSDLKRTREPIPALLIKEGWKNHILPFLLSPKALLPYVKDIFVSWKTWAILFMLTILYYNKKYTYQIIMSFNQTHNITPLNKWLISIGVFIISIVNIYLSFLTWKNLFRLSKINRTSLHYILAPISSLIVIIYLVIMVCNIKHLINNPDINYALFAIMLGFFGVIGFIYKNVR